jgi:hypothetical protein
MRSKCTRGDVRVSDLRTALRNGTLRRVLSVAGVVWDHAAEARAAAESAEQAWQEWVRSGGVVAAPAQTGVAYDDRPIGDSCGAGCCVSCGASLEGGSGRRSKECGACAGLRMRAMEAGLDHTTITERLKGGGLEVLLSELGGGEAPGQGGVGGAAPARKPRRGRVCMVCDEMKALTDFPVARSGVEVPRDCCARCVAMCTQGEQMGLTWHNVREAVASGTANDLFGI